jgi:eukaryotic-like serine/threonine-protein kinase
MVPGLEQDITGQRLGRYRIVERIVAGGMGVVYQAVDTDLDRTVAIKVLRPDAAGPEHHRRLIQEAKTSSALNHPNIVTIYEIGKSGGVSFIAMEYVAGRNLEQIIRAKELRLAEALHYAIQIADALAVAHAAGITHRDIKPSNIMISGRGAVKVLDFGLAKLTRLLAAGDQTISMLSGPLTAMGTVVGTLAYMSPEQIEAKKVDGRCDIFSFGAVLYEMATGERAFGGHNAVSTLVAIAGREPRPICEFLPDSPAGLEQIVSGCLRKDPDQRFQRMEEVKAALEVLHHDSQVKAAPPVVTPRRFASRRLAFASIGLSAGLGVFIWLTKTPAPRESWRPILTRLTADKGISAYPTLSADGKLLAYASDRSPDGNLDIWVQQVGGSNPIRVTNDVADEYDPAFSPDGEQIAFRSDAGGGGIWLVPSLGGTPRMIARYGSRPLFSPDGTQILYWVGSGTGKVYVVDARNGQSREFQPEFESARYPVWSPDGKWILFLGSKTSGPGELTGQDSDWWVAPAARGPAVKCGALAGFRRAGMSAPFGERFISPDVWTEHNQVVFSARLGGTTNVWRIAVSPGSHQVTGLPERLSLGTQLESHARFVTLPDQTSLLVFASLARSMDVWDLPVDSNRALVKGELERVTQDPSAAFSPSVSLDGKRLVYISTRSGNANVWLKNLHTGKETAITASAPDKTSPSISQDGSAAAYVDIVNPRVAAIFSVSIDAEDRISPPRKLCEGCAGGLSWNSDGRSGLLGLYPPARAAMLDLATGQRTEVLRHPKYNVWQKTFSADGRWISFNMVIHPLRSNIYVARAPATPALVPAEQWIPVTQGEEWDDKPRWSADGNTLYFISQRDGFRCIWYVHLDPQTKQPFGDPAPLYHLHRGRLSMTNLEISAIEIGVARDKLVFALGELTGNIWMAQAGAQR